MTSLRKIISLFLVAALMVNMMGHLVIFLCNRYMIRTEMAACIRAGHFSGSHDTFVISGRASSMPVEFNGSDELYYHDMLYDVVSCTIKNDSVSYTCIRDRDEQNLLDHFTRIVQAHPDVQGSQKAKPILALLRHLLSQALPVTGSAPETADARDCPYPAFVQPIPTVFLPVFSPPPWHTPSQPAC